MVISKLENFINNENRIRYTGYDLNNIKEMLKYYGNPQKKIKSIHIAGTNGKGSVAHLINSILIESGYTTGLFTSPHLLKLNERIRIDNNDITNDDLNYYIDDIIDYVAKFNLFPTYFDIITLIAFRYFDDNNTDCAVFETGLGGRLDSTNVISPLCSIITEISIDHTTLLGKDLSSIASEKAGIIKQGIPIITSDHCDEVLEVITTQSEEKNADLYVLGRDFKSDNISFGKDFIEFEYSLTKNNSKVLKDLKLNLSQEFQIKNCSLAATAMFLLSKEYTDITDSSIKNGVLNVSIPGRFEVLADDPKIIFDPAHNKSAFSELISHLKKDYQKNKIVFVLSVMTDKDYDSILTMASDSGSSVIYYELDDKRCHTIDEETETRVDLIIDNISDLKNQINELNKIKADKTVFIFSGSFRLYKIAVDMLNEFDQVPS